MDAPPPPLPRRITIEAIEAAAQEFLRREDALGDNDDDDQEIEPVVIAHNVTIAELRTVPIAYFDRVKVALLIDDSLVVTDVKTAMHDAAVAELSRQLNDYARANGLVVARLQAITLPNGRVLAPDLALCMPRNDENNSDQNDEEPDNRE